MKRKLEFYPSPPPSTHKFRKRTRDADTPDRLPAGPAIPHPTPSTSPPRLRRTPSSYITRGPHQCTDPKAAFKTLFDHGVPPRRGGTKLSCEEGLIIRLSKLATAEDGNGRKPFNRWIAPAAAAGLLTSETYRRVARACIVRTARSALKSMRRHRRRRAHNSVPAPV